jgi:hypothetical protein
MLEITVKKNNNETNLSSTASLIDGPTPSAPPHGSCQKSAKQRRQWAEM